MFVGGCALEAAEYVCNRDGESDLDVLDGVSNDFRDLDAFARECAEGAAMGFDGKTLIHPAQIDSAAAAFTPTDQQVEAARKVLAALEEAEARGAGAAQLDGQMLDEAVAVAARRTLTKIGA